MFAPWGFHPQPVRRHAEQHHITAQHECLSTASTYRRPRVVLLAARIKACARRIQTPSDYHRPHTPCTTSLCTLAHTLSFTHPPNQPPTTTDNVRQGHHLHHRCVHRSCGRHTGPAGLGQLQHWPDHLLQRGPLRVRHRRDDAPRPARRRPRRHHRLRRPAVLAHQRHRRRRGQRLLVHAGVLPEQQRRRPHQHRLRPDYPLGRQTTFASKKSPPRLPSRILSAAGGVGEESLLYPGLMDA